MTLIAEPEQALQTEPAITVQSIAPTLCDKKRKASTQLVPGLVETSSSTETPNGNHQHNHCPKPELELPFGKNFVIQLRYGGTWDESQHPYSDILYADVQHFEDLVKYIRKTTAGLTRGHKLTLTVAYLVTSSAALAFHLDEWDNINYDDDDEGVGSEAEIASTDTEDGSDNHSEVGGRDEVARWASRFVQEQMGWDGVVFAAQRACAEFHGLQILVQKYDPENTDFMLPVLEDDEV